MACSCTPKSDLRLQDSRDILHYRSKQVTRSMDIKFGNSRMSNHAYRILHYTDLVVCRMQAISPSPGIPLDYTASHFLTAGQICRFLRVLHSGGGSRLARVHQHRLAACQIRLFSIQGLLPFPLVQWWICRNSWITYWLSLQKLVDNLVFFIT